MQNTEQELPIIQIPFDGAPGQDHPIKPLYREAIRKALQLMLPQELFQQLKSPLQNPLEIQKQLQKLLPHLTHTPFPQNIIHSPQFPFSTSFYVLFRFRPNAYKFFYDMIARWLIPGKRLNIVLMYAVDFYLPQISNDLYTICEVMISIENPQELNTIQTNYPILETEIRLGVTSQYYATKIMEIKGLSNDEKTAEIQEHTVYLIKRLYKHFDYDILTEMQHLLVMCSETFKAQRGSRHLSRIISIHYLFRKGLETAVKNAPEKRHLLIKIFKTKLHMETHAKKVLSLAIGVNFLNEKEIFEESHIIKTIQQYFEHIHSVPNSFFANKRGGYNLCTIYMEIEKSDGSDFTIEEIKFLHQALPNDLKNRIEHVMHPIFMPTNEEEIMRHILSLSHQLKYIRDVSQVILSFDRQTTDSLFFTVILVRILKEKDVPLEEMFRKADSPLEYIHDFTKNVGMLRKRFPKEANVFKVRLEKKHFLRTDHYLDLFKARQEVVRELQRVIGEVRDFNGGMIAKQNESLSQVHRLVSDQRRYSPFQLDNFFYSIRPSVMRNVLEPMAITKLFVMFLKAVDQQNSTIKSTSNISHDGFKTISDNNKMITFELEVDKVFVMITSKSEAIQEEIGQALLPIDFLAMELATCFTEIEGCYYLGLIYQTDDSDKQALFCELLQESSKLLILETATAEVTS